MEVHFDLAALPRFRSAVVTIGSFDGVHLGHRALIGRIRQLANEVDGETVIVTFDPHPRHVLPSSRPPLKLITGTAEKLRRLSGLNVDHVVIVPFTAVFAAQTARQYLEDFLFGRFDPHTVVIGHDHKYGSGREGDIALLRAFASKRDVRVEEIPARDIDELAVSSTRIRRAITAGDLASANTLLGADFALVGAVVHGDAIGRTIGFPTANLALDTPEQLLPEDGVYAVRATVLAFGPYPLCRNAMLYIGRRPSLDGRRPRTIEVNILDYEGDLYELNMRVELVERIRTDREFEGLAALRTQIIRDREAARELLAS